jgi:hypothetical protein
MELAKEHRFVDNAHADGSILANILGRERAVKAYVVVEVGC